MNWLGPLLIGLGVALMAIGSVLVAPSADAAETIADNQMDYTQANFREIYAKGGPYPGEDLIYYCNLSGSTATQIAWARNGGKPKELIIQEIKTSEKITEEPERQATLDIISWVFDRPLAKPGVKMYLEAGQWCLNARLAGTWYTYPWREDPTYPRYINPLTQQMLEF